MLFETFLLSIIFMFLFTYQVPGNVWGEAIAVVAVCLGSQTVNFVHTYWEMLCAVPVLWGEGRGEKCCVCKHSEVCSLFHSVFPIVQFGQRQRVSDQNWTIWRPGNMAMSFLCPSNSHPNFLHPVLNAKVPLIPIHSQTMNLILTLLRSAVCGSMLNYHQCSLSSLDFNQLHM